MRIIFLGTNGWFSTPTGDTPCILIKTNGFSIILDAGNGIYKVEDYIDKEKPIYLFLTHLHLDHISGLHILPKFHFRQPFQIFTPTGTKAALTMLLQHPFTKPINELQYPVHIEELAEGRISLPFAVCAIRLFHSDTNFGYRFELEGKIIAYSGDTGICENSKKLAMNADLLIHECSYEPNYVEKTTWGHTTPAEAANLAKETKIKKLVLTHFTANIYTSLKMRKEAEKVARKIFPNTVIATDGMCIEV